MESEEGGVHGDGQKHMRMIHYYFINYKQFVNVVKYRLDHMRRKLEMEEKKVRDIHVHVYVYCYQDLHVHVHVHGLSKSS